MPGVLIALGRLNRPGLMVYGGTIRPGGCASIPGTLDIVSAFQSYGQYLAEGGTPDAEKKRYDTVRNSCPGPVSEELEPNPAPLLSLLSPS